MTMSLSILTIFEDKFYFIAEYCKHLSIWDSHKSGMFKIAGII